VNQLTFTVLLMLGATSLIACSNAAEPPALPHLILAVEEGDSSLGFYDSRTRVEVGRVYFGHVKETQRAAADGERHRSYVGMWPHELAVSPDGKTAFVTHFGLKDYDELIGATGSTISVIDVPRMCETRRLYTFGFDNGNETTEEQYYKYRAPHGVKLQPNTSRLYVNVEANLDGDNDHHMLIYDLSSKANTPIDVWKIPEETHNFIFSASGLSMWLFSGRDGVRRYDIRINATSSMPVEKVHFKPQRGAIRGLTLSADETKLIASGSGEIIVLNPITLEVLQTIPVPGVRQFLYTSILANGHFVLAPAVWEGKVYPIDLQRGKALRPVILGSDPVHVGLAPHEKIAYVTHGRDNFISVLDVSQLPGSDVKEIGRIATHDGPNRIATIVLSQEQRAARNLRPERSPLRFGACLPLSGQNIVEGQDMRLGYQYWRDSVNERGGLNVGDEVYEVDLVFRDTQSLSKGPGVDAFVSSLTLDMLDEARRDEVPIVFLGTYPTPPNISSGRVSDNSGIPFVTAGAAGVVVYEQASERPRFSNVFGVMSPARGFLNSTMDMMFSENGALPQGETPPQNGVLISSDDFGAHQDAVTTGIHLLKHYGANFHIAKIDGLDKFKAFRQETVLATSDTPEFQLLVYTHPENDEQINTVREEFPKLLELVNEKAPEMVALTAHMPQAIDFTIAASKVWHKEAAEIPKAIVLSVGPGNPSFTQQLHRQGVSPENILGASVWSPNQKQFGHDEFIDSKSFREKFEARFHKSPSYLTAGAVASGLVYEEAFRRAWTIEHDAVRDALQSISDHPSNQLAEGSIELFYSRIDFRDDEQIRGLNDRRPLGTIQLQARDGFSLVEDIVLWPQSLAQPNAQLVYPFPGFVAPKQSAGFQANDSSADQWKY
tara:strand:- start:25447 stop:28116 length:2670 start_codon:yes stop_codon:yes gene_type:complete